MRKLLLALALALAMLLSAPACAQEKPLLWIDPEVHRFLALTWTADTATIKMERAYCVSYIESTLEDGRTQFYVNGVRPAVNPRDVGPGQITAECPTGMMHLHTHPPQSCATRDKTSSCLPGGPGAYQCWPSDVDERSLIRRGHLFALVQCDAQAVVPYWNLKN